MSKDNGTSCESAIRGNYIYLGCYRNPLFHRNGCCEIVAFSKVAFGKRAYNGS